MMEFLRDSFCFYFPRAAFVLNIATTRYARIEIKTAEIEKKGGEGGGNLFGECAIGMDRGVPLILRKPFYKAYRRFSLSKPDKSARR